MPVDEADLETAHAHSSGCGNVQDVVDSTEHSNVQAGINFNGGTDRVKACVDNGYLQLHNACHPETGNETN